MLPCKKRRAGFLDYQTDPNHNRLVVTVIGEPEPLRDAVVASFEGLWS